MNWTNEQKICIKIKGQNILVAAGAGSGKTAVLVERIIQKVLVDKIDIDKILIVTFTKAAALEMKQRLNKKLYEMLEKEPNNPNLARQLILLNKANISTIDSFCLSVVKSNYYKLDISPTFKILDSAQEILLMQDVLEEMFDEKYESSDKDFEELLNVYTTYKTQDKLKEIIIKIFNKIQSNPYPKKYLEEIAKKFDFDQVDFGQTIWGKILIDIIDETLENSLKYLYKARDILDEGGMQNKVLSDIEKLENLKNAKTWDEYYLTFKTINFDRWAGKSTPASIEAKSYRDEAINVFKQGEFIDKILSFDSNQIISDLKYMSKYINILKNLILEFDDRFLKAKKAQNSFTFSDIAHFALEILIEKIEDDKIYPTQIAKEYQKKFEEIAIDEYQDSNLIQEYILNSVSKDNIFMVGDVKQSIYKFRQAMPELFLDKYNKYSLATSHDNVFPNGMKVQLFKNFRSRENVIDFTNYIFQNILSINLGDIDYTKQEYLNYGANYDEKNIKTQIEVIEIKENNKCEDEENENVNENEKVQNNIDEDTNNFEVEALHIAQMVEELIASKMQIMQDGKLRDIEYKDIVILLRSTKNKAQVIDEALKRKNIPTFCENSNEYLNTYEINLVLNLLKVIDNPINDIALIATLRSYIFEITDDELQRIRLLNPNLNFYELLKLAKDTDNDLIESKTKEKIENFFSKMKYFRQLQNENSIEDFLWTLYNEIAIKNYVCLMRNSKQRIANLNLLLSKATIYNDKSYKGLYPFIQFIEKLKESKQDLENAKIMSEADNVVRIMTIHKSKGLEFPVVILANSSKSFNQKELNDDILLHNKLGFGLSYINNDELLKYKIPQKIAIQEMIKYEEISEEMRVLYVALTRAKEKLIITGFVNSWDTYKNNMEKIANIYEKKEDKIDVKALKKQKSYFDWIMLSYMYDIEKFESLANINVINKSEILDKEYNLKQEYDQIIDFKEIDEDLKQVNEINFKEKIFNILNEHELNNLEKIHLENIQKQLNYIYDYDNLTKIVSKTSVSAIKQNIYNNYENDDYDEVILDIEQIKKQNQKEKEEQKEKEQKEILEEDLEKIKFEKPEFIEQKKQIVTNARLGTIYHLIFEKLENISYDDNMLKSLILALADKKLIKDYEINYISLKIIKNYLASNLFKKQINSKNIMHEIPFFMYMKSDEIYLDKQEIKDKESKTKSENIVVQGIIDLYFEDENGKTYLVDYKTDKVNNKEELIKKYKVQLELYKRAIEKAKKIKVDYVYIYSTQLGEILI